VRLVQYRVEYRREVAGQGIDDLQYLGGCSLPGQCLVPLSKRLVALGIARGKPPLQLGNEGTFMMTEEVSKTNMLLAEMAQVELNQHAAEDWQAKQSVALTEERFGDGHGLWNGMKTWQPTPLVREW